MNKGISDMKLETRGEVMKVSETVMIPHPRPDDCPRCQWRKGCPYGQVYYGLQMHRCNQGIFELDPTLEDA